jgi:hypothetical protein
MGDTEGTDFHEWSRRDSLTLLIAPSSPLKGEEGAPTSLSPILFLHTEHAPTKGIFSDAQGNVNANRIRPQPEDMESDKIWVWEASFPGPSRPAPAPLAPFPDPYAKRPSHFVNKVYVTSVMD